RKPPTTTAHGTGIPPATSESRKSTHDIV
ncbi:unnamed protein product, partial [Rotaria socialis]